MFSWNIYVYYYWILGGSSEGGSVTSQTTKLPSTENPVEVSTILTTNGTEAPITTAQSHYIDVAQGGVSSRAIHNCIYLAYFEPKKIRKKYYGTFQCYNVFKTFQNIFFAHENMKKNALKSCS